MITRAGDIYCEQGETFTVGFRMVNPDGSPFVLSNALDVKDNAGNYVQRSYLLLTIASSANITGKDRYLGNFWNPTDKYDKFYSTEAIKLNRDENGDWPTAAAKWDDLTKMIVDDTSNPPAGTTPINYAIYYIVKDDGSREYKHMVGTSKSDASFEPYLFQFYQHIPKAVSQIWSQSGYDYALKVVTGKVDADYGKEGHDRPINIEFSYPLIGAHKLYVDTNVQGSLDTNVQGSLDDVEVVNE